MYGPTCIVWANLTPCSLQFANGTRALIHSKYAYSNGSIAAITADDQLPVGITWAMNPLPDGKQKGSLGAVGEWEFGAENATALFRPKTNRF
jgi:hypothetical protein